MKYYIDIMTAYVELVTTPVLDNTHVQWKFVKRKNKTDNHFLVRYRKVSCRYDPNRYGTGQIKYIRQKLHERGLHTAVSEFEDLEPVQLLK